jgi:UrcA family protein
MNLVTVNLQLTALTRTALLVGCSLVGALGVAQADTPTDEAPSLVVRYGDLDLATDAGVQALYRRLAVAAQEVCPFEDSKSLAQVSYSHTCRAKAIARAVHDINSPRLAALQAGHSNRG